MSHVSALRRSLAAAAAVVLAACTTGPASGPVSMSTPAHAESSGTPGSASAPTSAGRTESASATGSQSSDARSSAPADSLASTSGTCAQVAAKLSLAQQVGQLYMMGVTGTSLGTQEASRLRDLDIGSVVLLGQPPRGVAGVRALTDRIRAAGDVRGVPVLVSADQEGGTVQRLTGSGFSTIPRATVQATSSAGALRASWVRYGTQMRQAGVQYDLAPVTDLVTASNVNRNAPIGQLHRNYGTTPASVVRSTTSVVSGLHQARVASAAKHFPGLGAVTTNTDYGVATDTTTTKNSESVKVFQQVSKSGVSSVMVSSAIYTKIDPGRPALFSHMIITGMLRDGLGFKGVIISDDLGQAGAVQKWPAAVRGTTFLEAGGDLALDADPASVRAMVANTLAKAKSNAAFRAQVKASAGRVLTLKAQAGLITCRA